MGDLLPTSKEGWAFSIHTKTNENKTIDEQVREVKHKFP